jgi:hypothetical protein
MVSCSSGLFPDPPSPPRADGLNKRHELLLPSYPAREEHTVNYPRLVSSRGRGHRRLVSRASSGFVGDRDYGRGPTNGFEGRSTVAPSIIKMAWVPVVAAAEDHPVVSSKLALRSRKMNVRGRSDHDLTVERVRGSVSDWFWCDIYPFLCSSSRVDYVFAFLWRALAFSAPRPFSLLSLRPPPSILVVFTFSFPDGTGHSPLGPCALLINHSFGLISATRVPGRI